MKVLIAEDQPTSRMLLERTLRRWGHEVLATEDGIEALKAVQQDPEIEAAILDWEMPRMDGLKVCRMLASLEREVFTILMSANRDNAHVLRALEAGADDYITKPFDPERLQESLSHVPRKAGGGS